MDKLPQISDAEWEVMKVIWERGALTAGGVVEALDRHRSWRPRTVKTMLSRLVKKGAVRVVRDGPRYLYQAAVSQTACIRQESGSFLCRVFGGAVTPAIVHLLSHARLLPDEIEELKRILEKEGQR